MKDEKNRFIDVERNVQKLFQKQAESLKASKDLWSKLEPKLDKKLKDTESSDSKRRLGTLFAGPRLIVVSTSISVVLIMIVVGSMWLTTNHSGNTVIPPTSDKTMIEHGLGIDSGQAATTVTPTFVVPETTITLTQPPPAPITFGPVVVMTTPSPSGLNGGGSAYNGSIGSNPSVLDTAGRQVISQASISLEVDTVSTALTQVETMAEGLGGLVDSMSSSGEQNQQQATIIIRVPQDQFLTALDKLQSMGTVQNQDIASQDVTQQYIDLQAQLNSAQLEKQSLQAILDKAQTISDEIAIQEQLAQVESQIESLQGQINYIQNRVNMATINVTLNGPTQNVGQPPSASLTVAVSNVDSSFASVKQLVSGLSGIIDSSSISLSNGKESAYLNLSVYRSSFDQVVMAIGKEGKIKQKTIQEAIAAQNVQSQPSNSPPDASITLSLIEASGFWTTTNTVVISVAGGVVILTLLIFLILAGRAGLLSKRKS